MSAPSAALKETCRVTRGRIPLWPWHRARLKAGGVDEATLALADEQVETAAAQWARKGISELEHAVRLNPRNGLAWLLMGVLHWGVGEIDGAITNCQTAANFDRTTLAYLTLANGRLGAAECLQFGLVNKVAKPENLIAEAEKLAAMVCGS